MKDSFIVRKKYRNQIQKLTANQRVELMECIFSYQLEGKYESEDGAVCMLLDIMIDEWEKDDEKYLEMCEKNREIALERERKKKLRKEKSHEQHERVQPCTNVTNSTDNDSDSDYDNDSDNDKKKKEKIIKKKFLDFVQLSDDEHKKLIEKFGAKRTDELIEKLNNYIGSTGKRYKSHYYTILNRSRNDPGGNKDYEREKQQEFRKQKILKQFYSDTNGDENTGNQTEGYNRRNDLGFKELSG